MDEMMNPIDDIFTIIDNELIDLKSDYSDCCFSNRRLAKQISYAIMELETVRWMINKKLEENDIF